MKFNGQRGRIRKRVPDPALEFEVQVVIAEPAQVDNGTRDGRHAAHGGSQVASRLSGMPRPPKLLCGLLEDRTWAMMPQRGGMSPTAVGVLDDAGWSGCGVDVGQGETVDVYRGPAGRHTGRTDSLG
jgi:hypothetical protein